MTQGQWLLGAFRDRMVSKCTPHPRLSRRRSWGQSASEGFATKRLAPRVGRCSFLSNEETKTHSRPVFARTSTMAGRWLGPSRFPWKCIGGPTVLTFQVGEVQLGRGRGRGRGSGFGPKEHHADLTPEPAHAHSFPAFAATTTKCLLQK